MDAGRPCTPRRRLHEALQMEAAIAGKLETDGWERLMRAGRKIGAQQGRAGMYVLVTAFAYPDSPSLRISMYVTSKGRLHELRYECEELWGASDSRRNELIFGYVDQWRIDDENGDLVRVADSESPEDDQVRGERASAGGFRAVCVAVVVGHAPALHS